MYCCCVLYYNFFIFNAFIGFVVFFCIYEDILILFSSAQTRRQAEKDEARIRMQQAEEEARAETEQLRRELGQELVEAQETSKGAIDMDVDVKMDDAVATIEASAYARVYIFYNKEIQIYKAYMYRYI